MNRFPVYARIFGALVLALLTTTQANGQTASAHDQPAMGEIATGKQLFATSCANSFCHGSEGGPGRGPRLRDRDWEQSYLYRTIEDGIPGSPMPGWKGRLSEQQIHAVIRYILSISHPMLEAAKTQPDPSDHSTPPVAKDDAAVRGRELFFDLNNERNCGVCHRIGEAGVSIGPSLDLLSSKPNPDILASIVRPHGQAALRIRTSSGEMICGVKAGGDSTTLQIYDIPSSGPPVLRTFSLQEIVSRSPCEFQDPHAGFSRVYNQQQLADIVAFLKSCAVDRVVPKI